MAERDCGHVCCDYRWEYVHDHPRLPPECPLCADAYAEVAALATRSEVLTTGVPRCDFDGHLMTGRNSCECGEAQRRAALDTKTSSEA